MPLPGRRKFEVLATNRALNSIFYQELLRTNFGAHADLAFQAILIRKFPKERFLCGYL